jgi:hypothetical protein
MSFDLVQSQTPEVNMTRFHHMHQGLNVLAPHEHEWVVFSTAYTDGFILVQCVGCGRHGLIDNPPLADWRLACEAHSCPHPWCEEELVEIDSEAPDGLLYVMRASRGPRCDCYARLGVRMPEDYERVPAEILRSAEALTDEGRAVLEALAEIVVADNVCTQVLVRYLRDRQEQSGREVPEAVWRIARQIELASQQGMHCSASVVAHVFRECTRRGATQM